MEPHLTSIGQTLLAHLDAAEQDRYLATAEFRPLTPKTILTADGMRARLAAIRDQGWCLVSEELELGLVALAVPVRGERGGLVGACNVTGHTSRIGADEFLGKMLPEVREAALTIETDTRHAGL